MNSEIENVLLRNRANFHPVVRFHPSNEKLLRLDFSSSNNELTAADINDTQRLSHYIDQKLKSQQAKFGIGGYNENRVLYKRSSLFENAGNTNDAGMDKAHFSVRSIHLGIDIWGPIGTRVFAPLGGMVHSSRRNLPGDARRRDGGARRRLPRDRSGRAADAPDGHRRGHAPRPRADPSRFLEAGNHPRG